MLDFSSTVLPAPSLYLIAVFYILHITLHNFLYIVHTFLC